MFVRVIFPEQNILLPNLVWWCSLMSQSAMRKNSCLLSLRSRSRSQQGLMWWKYDSFYCILWTVDSLATKLGLMIHHHSQNVLWKKLDYCFQGQRHSEGSKYQCLSRYVLNWQIFCYQTWYCDASSWAWVHAKRLVCYFQGQGHSKGSYYQNMTVSTISAELLILLLPNLVWWYIIISQSVLWRYWIVMFKVKVTAKVQNVDGCLSRWYLLNHWTFYSQTWSNEAPSWARLSSKTVGLLSSWSRSQWRII